MRQLLILAAIVVLAHGALATPPATIGYQGRLLDTEGDPVPDGVYSMTFRFYDAEFDGTLVWFETHDVSVADGIFDVIIGGDPSFDLYFFEPLWLSTQIDGDPELTPRTELAGVPYAMRALHADLDLPYYGTAGTPNPAFVVENDQGGAIIGRAFVGPGPGTAAVLGESTTGPMLGGFVYMDTNLDVWGMYTSDDAYIGGGLTMPSGAADGHVLTSNASGDASWQAPAGGFTLPYSGSAWSTEAIFELENTNTGEVARFIGTTASDIVEVGMGDWTGHGLRLGGSATYAKIGGGTSTSRNDIVIDALSGDVGIGTLPGEKLDVDGTVRATGVMLTTSPADGHVLTSDASGYGTWQAPAEGFTLPYSGSYAWGGGPAFAMANNGGGPAAHFESNDQHDIVTVGTSDQVSGFALQFSSGDYVARINGGSVGTNRNDIVIDHESGTVGIGANPDEFGARLQVNGQIEADELRIPGGTNGLPFVSDATGVGHWQKINMAGLADPLAFGGQTWDWDFTSGELDIDKTEAGPLLDLTNSSASGSGSVVLIRSTSATVAPASTQVLRVTSQKGNVGSFKKYTHDGYSAVDIFADTSTGLGLYVSGTITSTSFAARGVETSRGMEAVFGIETPEPEVYDSGEAFLSGGRAQVSFDRLFTEAVSGDARVRVTVTPVGGWSALYLESTGPEGFVVRSADGDPNIEFFWTACGLSRDHELGRQITFRDPE